MKTKRLELRPLNDRELGMLLNRQTEPELIKAYGEMLLGCRSKPDARLWYTHGLQRCRMAPRSATYASKDHRTKTAKRRSATASRVHTAEKDTPPRRCAQCAHGAFQCRGAILSVPRPRMATAHPSACLKNAVFAASASAGRATFGRSNVPRRQRYPHFSASAW